MLDPIGYTGINTVSTETGALCDHERWKLPIDKHFWDETVVTSGSLDSNVVSEQSLDDNVVTRRMGESRTSRCIKIWHDTITINPEQGWISGYERNGGSHDPSSIKIVKGSVEDFLRHIKQYAGATLKRIIRMDTICRHTEETERVVCFNMVLLKYTK